MALKRTRITKKSIKEERRTIGKERKTLPCKECGLEVEGVGADIKAITCADCCIKMSAPPELPQRPKPESERRPRGWQFMKEYRAPDGTLYRRGEKVNEEIPTKRSRSTERPSVRKTGATKDDSNNSGHPSSTGASGTSRKRRAGTKVVSRKRTNIKSRRSTV